MIHGRLGAELIQVQRIGSSVVFHEDLDLTWRNTSSYHALRLANMPISAVSVLWVFSTAESLLLG
jgi:hypothetical protein